MKIYHFDSSTGEFLGVDNADPSPMEPEVFLIPVNATTISPPSASDGSVAVFNNGEWSEFEDHRGVRAYSKSSGESLLIDYVGPINVNHTFDEPGLADAWDNIAQSWTEDATKLANILDDALSAKLKEIDDACNQHVLTEFTSTAKGSVYSYDCSDRDQTNLVLAINGIQATGNNTTDYRAKAVGAGFVKTSHTLAELQQVAADMELHIWPNRDIATSKKDAANLARNANNIDAIRAVDVKDWNL